DLHPFLNPFVITATLTDPAGHSNSATKTVPVGEVPLKSADGASYWVVLGQPVVVGVGFSDANLYSTADEFTGTINWGGGGPGEPATVTGGGGSFSVGGSHTYTAV